MVATNPDAVFPEHNVASSFSFPKQEEDVLSYWKEIDAVCPLCTLSATP